MFLQNKERSDIHNLTTRFLEFPGIVCKRKRTIFAIHVVELTSTCVDDMARLLRQRYVIHQG